MAADVTSYNAKVGRLQGGDAFYMKTDGNFQFFNTTLAGRELELQLLSPRTITQHASADISSGSVLSPAYGTHVFSAATGMSKASATMPTASYGATIGFTGSYLVTDANISVLTNSTVGLVLNTRGSDLSSFEMSAGNFVNFTCTADGTWQVVGENNYTEHASS
jgi:hypothetical protein